MREPKIEGLDLYTYVYIYICVWFELNFFYWTSHPKTGLSGWKLDTWQPYRWMVMFWDMTDFCMKLLKTEWKINQRGRRSIQMLHDLVNDGGFVALKRAAEDRDGWRQKGCQKPAVLQKITWWWQAAIPTATILLLSCGPWYTLPMMTGQSDYNNAFIGLIVGHIFQCWLLPKTTDTKNLLKTQ